jgi:hypothetical protein
MRAASSIESSDSVASSRDGKSLPITIQVTQDVPVGQRYCVYQVRGTLCSSVEFTITKGQRFEVVELRQEGECRIEFTGTSYELASCPWMPGFTDGQTDKFEIVQVPAGAELRR